MHKVIVFTNKKEKETESEIILQFILLMILICAINCIILIGSLSVKY